MSATKTNLYLLTIPARIYCGIILVMVFAAYQCHSAVSFSYDSLNRLTNADYGNGSVISYTYDAAGNRLTYTSGIAGDTNAPTIAISNPTSDSSYTTTNPTVSLGGTASDNVGVTLVTWANDRSGIGTANGTTNWDIPVIHLKPGTNVLSVTAFDATGNHTNATLTITLSAEIPKFSVSVSASASNAGTVVGSGLFAAGSSRTVTATPNSGFVFTNWTDNGSVASSFANYTLTVDTNHTLVANFVSSAPPPPVQQLSGFTFNSGVCSFMLNGSIGSNYVIQVSSNLVNWTTLFTNTIPAGGLLSIIDSDLGNYPTRFYRAVYLPITYTLNVSGAHGSYMASPNQSAYQPGSPVSITAIPDPGYQFTGWTGDTTNLANPLPLTINTNMSVTANFTGSGSITNIVFSDDFNDGSIDPTKWTFNGATVQEINGYMRIGQDQTDAGGNLYSIPVPINTNGDITITRNVRVHHANQFFHGDMIIHFAGLPVVGIEYAYYQWDGNSYYGWEDRIGTYISRSNACFICASSDSDIAGPFPIIWDNWFAEKVIYSPTSGNLALWINDALVTNFNVGIMPPTNNPTIQFQFGSWGWWTGHEHLIDNFVVSQTTGTPIVSLPDFTITQQPTNQVVTNGGTAIFSVIAASPGPLTYQWQHNGTNLPESAIITTVAGIGTNGYSGDGGFATSAALNQPFGTMLDSAGNLFIADSQNFCIRKVNPDGIISTVAGNGTQGYSGDGGLATNARLNQPQNLAMDAAKNLFIADSSNGLIRRVDTNGIITTVAGNGSYGYSGDGGAATNASLNLPKCVSVDSAGNLFIADFLNNRIRKVDTNGIITTVAGNGSYGYSGDGGAATNAMLKNPISVALDSAGNLFVSDFYNYRIRKVNTNGVITTVAGNGANGYSTGDGGAATNATLSSSTGVAVDGAGNIFIADVGNYCIRKVDTSGIITTVAGNSSYGYSGDGGSAVMSSLSYNFNVSVDSAGDLFIGDSMNNRVRKVTRAIATRQPTLTIHGITTNYIGSYSVVVSDSSGSVTSSVATLNMPAFIVSQPQNQHAFGGGSATLNVTADGTWPIQYQWSLNGTNLFGATNASLTVNNASATNEGVYAVTVTNLYGGVTSMDATFVVSHYITQQPTNQVVTNGGTAAFSVAVSGPGTLTYQWLFNGSNFPSSGLITTIAGNGTYGYSGDGGAATSATLKYPGGLAMDAAGSLFIADQSNHRIRKIDTNGIISTVAGIGTNDYSGDGGFATNAALNFPTGVTIDSAGNLFIADSHNERIRKVDTNGIITTVAGNGYTQSIWYPWYPWPFVTGGYSGDGGAATNAELNTPNSIAIDSAGNLFIADADNSRVRKVDIYGIITTVAGNGTNGYSGNGGAATNAMLNYPSGVMFDKYGNLLIADSNNSSVRKIDTNGIISTVAGNGTWGNSGDGGAATNATLSSPYAIAIDIPGNLYIADGNNNVVRKVDNNGIISTIAGNGNWGYFGDGGPATSASFSYPFGLVVDQSGNLFIADNNNSCIRKVATPTQSGLPTLTVNTATTNYIGNYSVVISDSSSSITSSVAVLNMTAFIVSQPQNQHALDGATATFNVTAAGTSPFQYQWAFNGTNLVGATNASLTVTHASTNSVGIYTVAVSNLFGGVTSAGALLTVNQITQQPISQTATNGGTVVFGVAVSGSGPFSYQWQLNGTNLPASGIISTVVGNGTNGFSGDGGKATNAMVNYPGGVAMDSTGNLYFADSSNNRVRKVGTNGIITTVAGNGTTGYFGDGGFATNAVMSNPVGVALDSFGNLFIAANSSDCQRIRKVDANGIITVFAGNGTNGYSGDGGAATNAAMNWPMAVAADIAGNLFIADGTRIRKVDTNGIITTVAGNGTNGFSGDGGIATNAMLANPVGLVVDQAGNLFIADNNRVREVDTNGIITTVAGNGNYGYSGDNGPATNASLTYAYGVAVDNSENLFVIDLNNNLIRKVGTNGIITTVAGNGNYGYSGDGGLATSAALNNPFGVTVDGAGNLIVSDAGNSRIRKVAGIPPYPPTLSTLLTVNVTNANAGNYTVVVSDSSGSITSSVATLFMPAFVAIPPQDQQACLWSPAIFTVTAGHTGPYNYQWTFNGTNIDGATNEIYIINSVSVSDGGVYAVGVSNLYGGIMSSGATLTPLATPPLIMQQPVSQTNIVGGRVTFTISAAGCPPMNYIWQQNGNPIADATNASFSITNLQLSDSGNQFSCMVSNAYGTTNSLPATLIVNSGISSVLIIWDTINANTMALSNALTRAGMNVTFSATSENGYTGSNPSPASFNAVIHLNGTTYNNDMPLTGQTILSNYVAQGGGYLHSEWDAYEYSNGRMQQMRDLILFDRSSGSQGTYTATVVSGQAGHAVMQNIPATFTCQACWNIGTIHPFAVNPSTVLMRQDANDAVAVRQFGLGHIVGFNHAGNYNNYNTLSDTNIEQLYINGINWTVAAAVHLPSISAQPQSLTVLGGSTAKFNVTATGTAPLTYQWRFNGTNLLPSVTTPNLTITNILNSNCGNYSVVISNPGGSITSSLAGLVILLPPQIHTAVSSVAGMQIQITGTPNYPYILQSATNLTPPINWLPVLTNPADSSGNWSFTVTNLMDVPGRFYRAVGQ